MLIMVGMSPLKRVLHHHQLDFLDGAGWGETLGAHFGTIHDRAAAKQPIYIIQIVETLLRGPVPAVNNKTLRLQQTSGSDKLIRVPP